MLSISSSRIVLASPVQNVSAKSGVFLQRVLRQRFHHHHRTTGPSSSQLVLPNLRGGEDKKQSKHAVYQRAMPRYIAPSGVQLIGLSQYRSFSTTEAQRSTYRQRVTDRASHMRDSARETYKEFREHPKESMREGAKSFSGMMRKYGPVFVGTYAGVYLTTLGSLFACVQSGLLDPAYLFSLFGHVDAGETKNTIDLVLEWMKNHSITQPYVPFMERNPYLANLAVAWIAVKFTEPIRAAVALAITPRVSRALGYTKANEDVVEEAPETTGSDDEQTESAKEGHASSSGLADSQKDKKD